MGFANFSDVKAGYANLWSQAIIRPEHEAAVKSAAEAILAHKQRYVVAAKTVPWWWTGIIHHMEGNGNFSTHLHNGDSLAARTVHVPQGRPVAGDPPFTWEESAFDALQMHGLTEEHDWSFPKACWNFERFNGFGYISKGIDSPYVWSFTTNYTKGKFVADHEFDPNAVSQQCGAAAILKQLIAMGEVQDSVPVAIVATPKPKDFTMSDLQTFLKQFSGIAPTLVTLVAGPGAGLAVKAIAEALTMDVKSDPAAVHAALDATAPSKLPTVIGAAEQIAQSLQPAPAPQATPPAAVPAIVTAPDLPDFSSVIDSLFPALKGWKTIIGVVIGGAAAGAHYMGLFPSVLTDGTVQGIEAFAGTLATVGLIAKIDRGMSMLAFFKAQTSKA